MKALCTAGMWLLMMCGMGGAPNITGAFSQTLEVPAHFVQPVGLNYHDFSQPRIIRVDVTAKSVTIVRRIASNTTYAIIGGGGPPDKLVKTIYNVVNGEIDTANPTIIEGHMQPPATTPEIEVWPTPEPRPAPKQN